MRLIVAGYSLLFIFAPHLFRSMVGKDPFKYTGGFFNIQSFNDLLHICALTPMVITGNADMVPMSIFVYFSLDVLYNFQVFMINTAYLVHHISGCFMIYIIFKYFMDNIEKFGFFMWVQETALIPIILMDTLRMKSIKIPKSLYLLRALWYLSTRVYTYGFFFYNYGKIFAKDDKVFGGYDFQLFTIFCTPLILHNTNVFRLQIKSMLRILNE